MPWIEAGTIQVWFPDGEVFIEHEHQAIGVSGKMQNGMITCSRADWAEFVKAVKAGTFDVV